MVQFRYTITDAVGIHARPAGLLVKESSKFQSSISLHKGEDSADCKKLFAILKLGVKCGQELTVRVEGDDAQAAAAAMEAFFKENL